MVDIDKIDHELYRIIYIEKNRTKFLEFWEELRQNDNILKEAITFCKDRFNNDTVKGRTISEQILYDYENVNKEIYQELINLIYTNKNIAREVIHGASNGDYSYLLISLFNFDLKLTEEQKIFAVDEAMNKIGTTRWDKIQDQWSKKLDDMGINNEKTVYIDFGGSINPIGAKSGAQYINYMMTSLGKEQAHGCGEFDIRYHILRNPNWTLEEKQTLIMDFWADNDTYSEYLEQWEWGIVNDSANYKDDIISPLEPFFLYDYTYNGLLSFYDDKETTDRIWDEIQFCKQMHQLRSHKDRVLEKVLRKN